MSKIHYEGTSAQDDAARAWVEDNFGNFDGHVSVLHRPQDAATVNPRDLVRTQHYLPDDRLVRVDHVSPRHVGGLPSVFITVEQDLSEPRPRKPEDIAAEAKAKKLRHEAALKALAHQLLNQERLLSLWFAGDQLEKMQANRNVGTLTLETTNGYRLFTRPKRTMHRDSPYEQYREVDGLAYWFVNKQDQLVDDFTGNGLHSAQRYQSTFGYFGTVTGPKILDGFEDMLVSMPETV